MKEKKCCRGSISYREGDRVGFAMFPMTYREASVVLMAERLS